MALIGIPYTCADWENNAQDLLAIPHEIGHYVYWHGRIKEDETDKKYINLRTKIFSELTPYPSSWYPSWVEEIFADIYSTLVAGPIGLFSLQNMLYDNLHWQEDDGRHPIPRLRPNTHFKVLKKYLVDSNTNPSNPQPLFPNAVEDLEENWDKLIQQRGLQITEHIKVRANESDSISYQTAEEYIERVTDEIFNVLSDKRLQLANQITVWGLDKNDLPGKFNDSPEKLFKQFRNEILNNDNEELSLKMSLTLPERFANKKYHFWFKGNQLVQWFLLLEKIRTNNFGPNLSPAVWETLIINNGWAVGGPEDDADSK